LSRGIRTSSETRGCIITGNVHDSQYGAEFGGAEHSANVVLYDCDTGLVDYTTGRFVGSITTNDGGVINNQSILGDETSLTGSTPALTFDSTKNGTWATTEPMGALHVKSADTSGTTDRGKFGLYPTGSSNSASRWKFDVDGVTDVMQVRSNMVRFKVGTTLAFSSIADLDAPSANNKFMLLFCIDTDRSLQLVYSDETNWRYVSDNAIIS